MSWLDDRLISYVFSNGLEEIIIEAPSSDERPQAPRGYTYKGFLPEKVNLMTKVGYEQNGRKGYKVDVGTGRPIYRSATRERFEHQQGNTGDAQRKRGEAPKANESVYTKGYGAHVKEQKKAEKARHVRNLTKILKGGK